MHNGTPEDPRVSLIEVKAKCISYWKHTVSSLGFMKEVGVVTLTGKVADTGVNRELKEPGSFAPLRGRLIGTALV